MPFPRPGSGGGITTITSTGGTVNVTAPTGPTTDLETAALTGDVVTVGDVATLQDSANVQTIIAENAQNLGPVPSGVAATDTAAVQAALTAGAGGTSYITQPGTFAINATLHLSGSLVLGPSTVLQASAAIAGPVLDTPVGTNLTNQSLRGGTIDANNNAYNCVYIRFSTNFFLESNFKNGLQDDVIIGDPSSSTNSVNCVVGAATTITHTGAYQAGWSCLWINNASDCRVFAGGEIYGQETGVRVSAGTTGGDNKFFGTHPFGALPGWPMLQCFHDEYGFMDEYHGCMTDTTSNVTHAGATGSGASSTITDASIKAQHLGLAVTGTNIPAGSFVGTVTAGTSFVLVNSAGTAVDPSGAVSGITLGGTGYNFASTTNSSSTIIGGTSFLAGGTTNTQVAVTCGPNASVKISNLTICGISTQVFLSSFAGTTGNITWENIFQGYVTTPTTRNSGPPVGVAEMASDTAIPASTNTLLLTSASLPAGMYLINWQVAMTGVTASGEIDFQSYVPTGAGPLGTTHPVTLPFTPAPTSTLYQVVSGSFIVTKTGTGSIYIYANAGAGLANCIAKKLSVGPTNDPATVINWVSLTG